MNKRKNFFGVWLIASRKVNLWQWLATGQSKNQLLWRESNHVLLNNSICLIISHIFNWIKFGNSVLTPDAFIMLSSAWTTKRPNLSKFCGQRLATPEYLPRNYPLSILSYHGRFEIFFLNNLTYSFNFFWYEDMLFNIFLLKDIENCNKKAPFDKGWFQNSFLNIYNIFIKNIFLAERSKNLMFQSWSCN